MSSTKTASKPKTSKLHVYEEMFAVQLHDAGIEYVREFRFAKGRQWRADFLINPFILIEIQGGVWTGGAHGRGTGIVRDYSKSNAAQALGYRLFQFTTSQVKNREAVRFISNFLNGSIKWQLSGK